MRISLTLLVMVLSVHVLMAQDKLPYRIFTKEGKPVEYSKVIKEVGKANVILFGELHDNSMDHWLELQVLKDLYAANNNMTVGMEMFEADDQLVLDEYLSGTIEDKQLQSEAKVWDNYKTDYKPLIEFAKENKVKVVATNIPRRYANLVFKKGIDALQQLPAEAKQWIAPLPVEIDLTLAGYKDMMAMASHGQNMNGENMAKSQAMKDATMAHFTVKNRKGLFLHYHGAYHSQNYEGIYWYLKKYDPSVTIATIHTVEQSAIDKLNDEHLNKADFIICIPKDMTKTY